MSTSGGDEGPGAQPEAVRKPRKGEDVYVACRAAAKTQADAAREAGITPRHASRLEKLPEIQVRIQAARATFMVQAGQELQAGTLEAIQCLRGLLARADAPGVQLGAARDILTFALKYTEAVLLEERISKLEKDGLEADGLLGVYQPGPEESQDDPEGGDPDE